MDIIRFKSVLLILYMFHMYGLLALGTTGQTKEYCSLETFNPTCQQGEVIQMKHALYGRMKLGNCVKDDYGLGTLGCSRDAIGYFDNQCSGRQQCELYLPIAELSRKVTCIKELSPYLEASYICQKEYCSFEKFKPTCGQDEIILIKHGKYGRMRIGRCVKDDYGVGTIGCSTDVHSYLDNECSGTRTCEISVPVGELSMKLNCLKEMSPYLEASYVCQKVFHPKQKMCTSPLTIQASSKSQYLSSVVTKETSCGSHQTPYIIEAKVGQHITITLIDFSVNEGNQDGKCVNYGFILDTGNDDVITLCGGKVKIGETYTSVQHQIQILLERGVVQNKHFLLKYEAKGCPQVSAPKHGWMKNENNTIKMGCQYSTQTWSLRCAGNVWLGIMRNCTTPPPVTEPIVIIHNDEDNEVQDHKGGIPHVSDNHLMAIAIGCVTVIICCVTVVLGVHCVKRYELNTEKKSVYSMSTLNHNVNTMYKTVPNMDTLMFSTNTMPVNTPQYTLNRDTGAPDVPMRSVSTGGTGIGQTNRDSEIYQSIHQQGSLLG